MESQEAEEEDEDEQEEDEDEDEDEDEQEEDEDEDEDEDEQEEQPPRKRGRPTKSCKKGSQSPAPTMKASKPKVAQEEVIQPQPPRKKGWRKKSCSQSLAPLVQSTNVAQFAVGDLVMAKMVRFPYWPGIFLKKGRVMFWQQDGNKIVLSTGKIKANRIALYKDKVEAKKLNQDGPHFKWEFAFANEIQNLSLRDKFTRLCLARYHKPHHFYPSKMKPGLKLGARVKAKNEKGHFHDAGRLTPEPFLLENLEERICVVGNYVHVTLDNNTFSGLYHPQDVRL
jgi:hypothetical protein